uniref:Uncharacterized protein n=1 Tax=Bracon brevicornis TaxID=1563983 RepID=A0A6V7IVT5_9HYME
MEKPSETLALRQLKRIEDMLNDIQEPRPDTPLVRAQLRLKIDYLKNIINSLPCTMDRLPGNDAFTVIRSPEEEKLFRTYLKTVSEKEVQLAIPQDPQLASLNLNLAILPRMKMRTFDGRLENWIPFSEWFTIHIHYSKDMEHHVKLCYLQDALTGEPAELIAGFTTANRSSYTQAWVLLNDRYDKEDKIMQRYLELAAEIPSLDGDEGISIIQFAIKFVGYFRKLNALSPASDSWKEELKAIVISKFDENTEEKWKERTDRIEGETPTVEMLMAFLQEERAKASATI